MPEIGDAPPEPVAHPGASSLPARVLVVADSDSYVKYGASLADRFSPSWSCRLVVAAGDAVPSERQYADGVAGTRLADSSLVTVDLAGLRAVLETWRPDVLVIAARGHTVRATIAQVDNVPTRPVIVSGIAGISIPVLPHGLQFRRGVDVFVVHSHREVEQYEQVAAGLGLSLRFELGTLPYLAAAPPIEPRRRIVFAAQALVPATRRQRAWLVDRLVETARAHPERDVVIKVRAVGRETQTHAEQVPLGALLAEVEDVPSNLLVEAGPMREHLRRACGFVTVSSTAMLEAIAAGVPALALDDFGVGAAQINVVLQGSGLLGNAEDLIAGRFRHPDPAWLRRNYFHRPGDDTWLPAVEDLVVRRTVHGMPPLRSIPTGPLARARATFATELAFRTGTSGLMARVESAVVRSVVALNRWRSRLLTAVHHTERDAAERVSRPER